MDLTANHQSLVDTFLERTIRDNEANVETANKWNIECVDASDLVVIKETRNKLIEYLRSQQQP